MPGTLIGKWELISSENVDELLKKLGVNFLLRQLSKTVDPKITIEVKDDVWSITISSPFKSQITTFELKKEFDEQTIDGRKFKTTFDGDENKLVQTQRDKEGNVICVAEHHVNDKDEMVINISADDVNAVRTFKRV